MEIRLCEGNQDIQALAVLAKEIWNEYFITIISQEQIDYMVNKFQSYDALSQAIHHEGYTYFLAFEQQELIGYCGVKPDEQRLFLSKLYLRSDMRGKGYASLLLERAIDFARELHKQALYLTCNKYNAHTLAVYEKKGFYQIDAVQSDIGHGFIMDDYVLQKDVINSSFLI